MTDKKTHGLADNQEGEFILNESGTSVSTDQVEGLDIPVPPKSSEEKEKVEEKKSSSSGGEEKDITD